MSYGLDMTEVAAITLDHTSLSIIPHPQVPLLYGGNTIHWMISEYVR